jgi:hypothetical protein
MVRSFIGRSKRAAPSPCTDRISVLDDTPERGAQWNRRILMTSRRLTSSIRARLRLSSPSGRPLLAVGADVLIVVLPFGSLTIPSLAPHTLQSCARQAGFEVDVLYANVLIAGV